MALNTNADLIDLINQLLTDYKVCAAKVDLIVECQDYD